ncbi:hypothetical protein SEPCBS119000_003920 [Sporothrix epigloea]|uniref:CCD97-like C-terminal domain-containing protein n=1 Tax=Sporothrix epigloea TaxID=1892477 RepID=A0ABP0DPJ5_9PEZI
MGMAMGVSPKELPGLSSIPSQARPRPDLSAENARRVRVRNRRLEYLRRNPGYLQSRDREFVNVALYNSLIRSFQTPAERAAEAQDSGFGHVLEASILRNPEPLQRTDDDDVEEVDEEGEEKDEEEVEVGMQKERQRDLDELDDAEEDEGDRGDGHTIDSDLPPREAAQVRWEAIVRKWFVGGGAGLDDGFDYTAVDDDSEYDELIRADAEAAWFDEEPPGWASDDDNGSGPKKAKTGETGIQDF